MSDLLRYAVGDMIDVNYENHHQQGTVLSFGSTRIGNTDHRTVRLRRLIDGCDVWANLTKAQSITVTGRAEDSE